MWYETRLIDAISTEVEQTGASSQFYDKFSELLTINPQIPIC